MTTETKSLSVGHKHLLQLCARSPVDNEGWATCSAAIWQLIQQVEDELLEKHPDRKACRLTVAGKLILKYL